MDKATIADTIGAVPSCKRCNSERVVKHAWACFNPESGLWELETVVDQAHCNSCDGDAKLKWSQQEVPRSKRIRELNDRFRMQGLGHGTILITNGIQAAGTEFVVSTMDAVQSYSDFNDDNDPWGEHDFGAVEICGEKIFFKLDYYGDDTLSEGSENPANEGKTFRVLTIMLASEY